MHAKLAPTKKNKKSFSLTIKDKMWVRSNNLNPDSTFLKKKKKKREPDLKKKKKKLEKDIKRKRGLKKKKKNNGIIT